MVEGMLCQAVTITIETHAQSGLARRLVAQKSDPPACPMAGTVLANRYLNTNAITIGETTIGITKIVRSVVLNRMLDVNPTASANAVIFTRITVTSENPNVNK